MGADIAERDIAEALAAGQFSLVYQPKIVIADGALSGVEALARWTHPRWGSISPDRFVPIIEASDLIHPFTEWVVTAAMADWTRWAAQDFQTTTAVNVSAHNLARIDFPDMVEAHCRRNNMPCSHLTVELTETAAEELIPLLDTLSRFRIKDIGVSLDDFGTGYSTAVRFDQLPFSEVKIDRSLVAGVDENSDKRRQIGEIIEMARSCGVRVVAEGVEDEATLQSLSLLGCDMAQGYHIGRPMAADHLLEWASSRPLQRS